MKRNTQGSNNNKRKKDPTKPISDKEIKESYKDPRFNRTRDSLKQAGYRKNMKALTDKGKEISRKRHGAKSVGAGQEAQDKLTKEMNKSRDSINKSHARNNSNLGASMRAAFILAKKRRKEKGNKKS